MKQRFEQNGGGQQPQERTDTDPKQNVKERPKTKRHEQHSRDPEPLGTELENDSKRPSKKTTSRSTDPTSKPDPEANTQKPKYRTADEEASYYHERCRSLESENGELHALKEKLDATNEKLQLEITKLQQSKEEYKAENEMIKRTLEEEKIQYSSASEKYRSEIDRQKSKCDALQASHIRSVNNIGTGLEPISDQEFESRFQALHDEVTMYLIPN
jgi:small-conductance mechanosensitive channel